MSEEAKSAVVKGNARRFLYIANPGSDESSGEEDAHTSAQAEGPPPQSQSQSQSYPQPQSQPQPQHVPTLNPPRQPRPLPAPSPSPLKTNLPLEPNSYHSPNPTNSSPSSTSSVQQSTPPPVTPGLNGPAIDLPPEQVVRHEPSIGSERNDGHITIRPTNMFDKLKAHLPHRGYRASRTPGHSNAQNTSPTASTPDSYTSPSTPQSSRTTPIDKLLIMVTTDADQYLTVEINGAKNPAIIRERIFTRLRVPDEDQTQYSIYRTKIGAFAIGEPLSDDQLYNLCCDRGDDEGSLRFFVSHASATVHDLSSHSTHSLSPTTAVSVSTIPPPVLPYNNSAYNTSLRPNRRPRSGSRHGSVSSASERLPPEVGAGYEASVSDDLDNADRDTNRSTMRPVNSKGIAVAFKNFPNSPDRHRRPSGPIPRPQSPLYTLGPTSPSTGVPESSTDVPPTRVDKYGSITPTPPSAAPPSALSPSRTNFDDNALTPPVQRRHARSGSDAAAEREQQLEASENQQEQADRMWQQQLQPDDRGKLDRSRDRNGVIRQERSQRGENQLTPEFEEGSDKSGQNDSWVVVPHDTPRATITRRPSTAHDTPRNSPSAPRERSRNHAYSPYKQSNGYGRPHIPNPPRNPPPPLPVGAGESRQPSSRSTPQAVPPTWPVAWIVPGRQDQKAPPVSTPQWNRITTKNTKSMTDLRNAAYNNHPASMTPGSRRNHQPSTRLPERGVSIPTNTYADGAASARELSSSNVPGVPKSYEQHRSPPRPLPKQASTSQTSALNISQSPPTSYGSRIPPLHSPPTNGYTALSPSGEPFPRPTSAFGNGNPVTAPPTQRFPGRYYGNDPDDSDNLSPHPMSPHRPTAVNGRLGFGRDEGTSISGRQGLRLNPNTFGSYVSTRSSDTYSGSDSRTPPRSPASPRSPRFSSRPATAEQQSGLFTSTSATSLPAGVEEGINSNETLRQENRDYLRQMLHDENGSATLIPKSVDIGQSPMPSHSEPPSVPPLPPIPFQHQSKFSANFSQSQSTLVVEEESDSDDEEGGTLWQTKPAPRSPKAKSISRDKSSTRVPQLTVETNKITNVPPSSFRSNFPPKPSDYPPPSRPPPDPPHDTRRHASHAPLTPNSSKIRQRGSTFTDNEYTWAPRPAPEEVYERLEDFFPEHDLDKPVIEASSSGAGSPTAAEYPAAPPIPEKDRSEKGLVKAKKSIRIVAEEHKKRIDRTSRAENLAASVLRKRSTKLWGSRLEEVTTEQAKAEQQRVLFNNSKPAPESPSGGPRPIFKWVRGELIGKGTYGRVYLALNATTGEMIAVKQVEIPQTASDKNDTRQAVFVKALKSESETLKDLDHPNVVQYLGFEETPNFLSIFLEYVPGGSIGSCLLKHGKFDEEVTKSFTEQILTGLEYLHSKGILHRDLKADNILVETTGVCKISDFGISKRTDDINGIGASTAMQGTVFWMAPEVIDTPKKGYDKKIDIWSVGCVVLEMWAGKRPWSGDEAIAVILKLHRNKLPPPVPDDVVLSQLAHNFRNKCFAINPEERPTAAELRKHPYLTLPPDWMFTGFKTES